MRSPRRSAAALLLAVLLAALVSCTGKDRSEEAPSPGGASSDAPPPGMDESLRDEALAIVDAREEALVGGDRDAFLASVDPAAKDFATSQAQWFDNLAELPLADVSLELGDDDVMSRVAGDGDLQLPVDLTMRLEGFDRRPVTRRMVYTFVRGDDDVLLADDRNIQIEAHTGWLPAPWDLTEIEVRRDGGVLGIFDRETVATADEVMADLQDAGDVVRRHVPRWSGRFVAYVVSDLQAMDRMSAMTVDRTAGVAFPVLADPDGPVAAFRFMVNPAHVGDPVERDVVFRHELVHVALAGSDRRSPKWLSEGVAEYVGRSVLPLDIRRRVAVEQVGSVRPRALEPSQRFYTRRPAVNYGLAALVCDYLATTRGEDVLWDLVRTFRTSRYTLWPETEAITRRELGSSTRDLVAAAQAWARG